MNVQEIPIAASLRNYGQLSPILLNRDYVLISGQRRLEAAKMLRWPTVKAVLCDREVPLEMLELEMEENVERRNFTSEELSDGFDSIERMRNPSLLRRLMGWVWNLIRRIFKRKPRD